MYIIFRGIQGHKPYKDILGEKMLKHAYVRVLTTCTSSKFQDISMDDIYYVCKNSHNNAGVFCYSKVLNKYCSILSPSLILSLMLDLTRPFLLDLYVSQLFCVLNLLNLNILPLFHLRFL